MSVIPSLTDARELRWDGCSDDDEDVIGLDFNSPPQQEPTRHTPENKKKSESQTIKSIKK